MTSRESAEPTGGPTTTETLVQRLRCGDRPALARILTIVENGTPEQRRHAMSLLPTAPARARTIGITGPPGAGKSTLTSALTSCLRARGRTVAILSIDPSSPFSGGALLGDRVRMGTHYTDPGVYIRSMASRGQLGGLALAAPQSVAALDAAGFDDIIVETVGVGQSEVQIAQTADTTILVLAPGLGDHVQTAKAGVLEIADILVVSKADNPSAQKLVSELRGMVGRGYRTAAGRQDTADWVPPIVSTVAVRDEGIDQLVEAVDAHTGYSARMQRRGDRARERVVLAIRELAVELTRERLSVMARTEDSPLHRMAEQVLCRQTDIYLAAVHLLAADPLLHNEFRN